MKTYFTIVFSVILFNINAQNFNWTEQNSGTSEWFNDIYFVDNQTGWAVGEKGTIVATIDGGETWTSQTSGTDQKLRSVFFLNRNKGWIVGSGTTKPILLVTNDGGANWASIPVNISESLLKKVQFYDDLNGVALALFNIYTTTNGGVNWKLGVTSPGTGNLGIINDLHVMSADSAFVCGQYQLNKPGIFENFTNPDGLWVAQGYGNFDANDDLKAIHITSAKKGFAGGTSGKIYTMEADGSLFPGAWEVNFDTKSGEVRSMDFSDNDHGMFSVFKQLETSDYQLIFHTSNTGTTWSSTPDTITGLGIGSLSLPDPDHAWIAGMQGKIMKGTRNTTSAFALEAVQFSVMPNPFLSTIMIKVPETYKDVQFNLYSYTGQLVKNEYIGNLQYNYDIDGLDHFKSGVYFLQLKSSDGKLNAVQKIIKF